MDTVFLGQSKTYQSQVVFSKQSHICNLCDCFVQRNAADARQDWRRNTTNGHCLLLNRKSFPFPTENLRSGWGDTRQVFQVGFVGPQREDVGGWWEGGWCRLGPVQCNPRKFYIPATQARLERKELGTRVCLPLPRPNNCFVWRMERRRPCRRSSCSS